MSESVDRLRKLSEWLNDAMLERLVFVGGGVLELLITDSAAGEIRTTKDVDCIFQAISQLDFNHFEDSLRRCGFKNDTRDSAPICRWINEELILDVMPDDESVLGFSNPWFRDAMTTSWKYPISSLKTLNIINSAYFLATKTEAFRSRGKESFRSSQDFEDIVTLVNGREELATEMHLSDSRVHKALEEYWKPKLNTTEFKAAIRESLGWEEDEARTELILERFRNFF